MYTIADREVVLKQITDISQDVSDIVGLILVGSSANQKGDRFSDLDLVVVVRTDVDVEQVWKDLTEKVKMLLKPEYHFMNTYHPGSYLTLFFLSNFLEIDLGVISVDQLTAKRPNWEIIFDDLNVTEIMTDSAKISADQDQNKETLSNLLISLHYGLRNCLVAYHRGNDLRVQEEIVDLRREILDYLGAKHDLVTKHHRDIDAFPQEIKALLLPMYSQNEDIITQLRSILTNTFAIIHKYESDSTEINSAREYLFEMLDGLR